jgi:hypothetical protein
MTQFGFLATNGSNQVLISSKTKNLHFLGKAAFYSTLQSSDNFGGIRRLAYRITSPVVPTPFFSVPTSDRCGISRITLVSSNLWEIELIRSGTSNTVPEVYIFTEVSSAIKPVTGYGMQVYTEDGSGTTFDSRLRPLVVRGGTQVMPPYDPKISMPFSELNPRYCSTDHGPYFAPDKVTSTFVYNTNTTKPIVNYQSVSQTMRQVNRYDSDSHRNWKKISFTENLLTVTYEYWGSAYWTFYRAGTSVQQSGTNSYINTGWIAIDHDCKDDYKSTPTYSIGGLDILELPSDTSGSGFWPYTNLTINLNPVPLIIADGTMYD